MITGYYKNEEETRKRFHNGWFYTGDAGIMVGPRKVKLLGRADDMVIMGGVKESPLVLEDTLRTGAGLRMLQSLVSKPATVAILCVSLSF